MIIFCCLILTRAGSNSHYLAEFLFTPSCFFILAYLFWNLPVISETCLRCPVIRGCFLLGVRGGLDPVQGASTCMRASLGVSTEDAKVRILGSLFSCWSSSPEKNLPVSCLESFTLNSRSLGTEWGRKVGAISIIPLVSHPLLLLSAGLEFLGL